MWVRTQLSSAPRQWVKAQFVSPPTHCDPRAAPPTPWTVLGTPQKTSPRHWPSPLLPKPAAAGGASAGFALSRDFDPFWGCRGGVLGVGVRGRLRFSTCQRRVLL